MNYQTYWWSPVSLCATCSFTVSFPLFRPPNLTSRAVRPMVTMITRLTNLIWKTLGMCPVSFLWPKNLVSKPASFASENKNRQSSAFIQVKWGNTVMMHDSLLRLPPRSFGRRCRLRSSGWMGESGSIPELDDHECEPDPSLPSTEDVIRKTEQITKNIQELLRAAQENKHERWEASPISIHPHIQSDVM